MKQMFRLACLFAFSLSLGSAQGTLRLEKTTLTVQTRTLEMKFDQGAVISVRNRLTGEEYVQRPGPRWFEMTHMDPRPGGLNTGRWKLVEEGGVQQATIEFGGSGRTLTLTVTVAADDEVVLRTGGRVEDPGLISATWGIFGLKLGPGRLVIPGQAGTYFDEHGDLALVGLDYPVHWEHQMVVYEGGKGSLLMYCADAKPRFQRLQASRQTGVLDMAFEMFATGPFADATEIEVREWRFAAFAGDWREPAVRYKARMNQHRPIVPPSGARAWIRDIRAVVMFLNSEKSLLDRIAKELIPSKTLIHFVDWRKEPFDYFYPDYAASREAIAFVGHAHRLGFRVMLHTNILGISEVHPLYSKFSPYQMKRATDLKRIGWLWDEFPSGHPQRVAYISPTSSEYRKLVLDKFREAIEEMKPDAIHLDAGGALINDGSGLVEGMNSMEGMIQLHKELIEEFPNIVWGGESTNEIVGPYNWLAQRWPSNYLPHPIGNFLLGDQVLFYGFLDQPTPDEPEHINYLKRYEGQGVLPAVILTSPADLGPDRKRMFDLLRQLRRWQEKQYLPDWSGRWESSLFRFRSADGESSASIETTDDSIRLVEDGKTIYERVRNSNKAVTPFFIEGWPAYDETSLLGLDPSREYWLSSQPYRPPEIVHLRRIPENYRIGTGSFAHARYGYFELEPVEKQWFDFVAEFAMAKIGVLYDGKDYPLVNGAIVTMGRVLVGGDLKNTVLLALPPTSGKVNGATFAEYKIGVPVAPRVRLLFEAGVADSQGKSDGVLFGVQLNGKTEWKKHIGQGKWEPGSLDLTQFAGSSVIVRFLTHGGEALNARFDYAFWSGVRLDVTLSQTAAPVTIKVPGGTSIRGFSEGVTVDTFSENLARARAALPGRFAVFLAEPPKIGIGESLLDFPYEVWKAGYGGLPFPLSVEGSGSIESAVSGRITRPISLVAVPPRNGTTLITTAVTIPMEATSLVVEYGLLDPPSSYGPEFEYTGTEFSLQINGEKLFADEVRTNGWRSRRIELAAYRGQRVLIQLKTDAQKLSLYDWARWTNLTVQ